VSQDSQLLQCTEEPAWLWQNLFLQVKHLKSKAVTAVEHPASPHASSEPTSIVEGVGEGSISATVLGLASLTPSSPEYPFSHQSSPHYLRLLAKLLLESKCFDYVRAR
jgi:hypothetical protein